MFTKSNAKALGAKGGRAQRDLLTQQLIAELNEIDPVAKVTKARQLVKSLLDNAIGGDTTAQREVWDRVEGKPHQESTVNIDDKRDETDWTRGELVAFLNDARKGSENAPKANGRRNGADKLH